MDPISKLLGTGNSKGIRPSKRADDRSKTAFVALVSNDKAKWTDYYDSKTQLFEYHGDNKKPGVDPITNGGNKTLVQIFDDFEKQDFTIPSVIFKKITIEVDGKKKGMLEFLGIGIPCRYTNGKPAYEVYSEGGVDNIIYRFKILDTGEENLLPWLKAKREDYSQADSLKPACWNDIHAAVTKDKLVIRPSISGRGTFLDYLKDHGFYYDAHFVEDFLLGLKVKPFMILCGGTGTGKTKITQLYSDYIEGEYMIIPVGSNWTESRFIVGYHNVISGKDEDTDTTRFLQKAERHPDTPYFLILDEMNLSHIERYFSEFLSAMESGKPIQLPGGREQPIPENLFIVGTMNLDETTYSISPKVLDRANVLLFPAAKPDFYLSRSDSDEPYGTDRKNFEFLENPMNSLDVRKKKAPEILKAMQDQNVEKCDEMRRFIAGLQDHMNEISLPIGYRSIDEMVRFIFVSWEYEDRRKSFDLERYMDSQIRMKILPKIHGDAGIDEGLRGLAKYLGTSQLPESSKEVARMISTLDKRHYTSFIR